VPEPTDEETEVAREPELVVAPNGRGARAAVRNIPSLLIGKSEAMRQVIQIAESVGPSNVMVLIEGESGTGKELVARTIHDHSSRANKPFIFVNCAALPEALVEAELFGHMKGAFTDARADKAGRFSLADGGTLFLDEIGDLPPKGQGDLLRVLEDGAFRMVGGTKLIRVDVRVIAATNRKLQEDVIAGKFREDLYYRLHVIPIVIPPLRDHAEDIPLLIDSFLADFSAKHGQPCKRLSPAALQLCLRYPWPGNVRQLRNIVERVVVMCRRELIEVEDLPENLREVEMPAPTFALRPGMTLAEAEKTLIAQTLRHVTSNRTEAAKCLGVSRRALQYKLKQYGLLDL